MYKSITDKSIRVIIISSEGKTFSAGHDLKELKKGRLNSDKGKDYFKKVMPQTKIRSKLSLILTSTCVGQKGN